MGLSASMIDALVDSGCTVEQLAALVKADIADQESARAERAERNRAGNADRQRRFRSRRKGKVTESNADNARNGVTPPNDIYSNPPVSSDDETRPVKKSKSAKPACPDGVEDQVWSDFLDHRKKKDAPVSPTVVSRIRREADKAGWTLNDAIAEVVARGWQGFKADWVDRPPGAANDGQPDRYAMIAEKYGSSP